MRIGCFIARVLGRTPNLRFEFLATWPAAIWLRGPKSPFVRPETGLGEGVTFAARRGREVAHLGPNVRVFQRPLDILWTEKSKLASMLVVWSPRGPGYMTWGECVGAAGYPMGCQIGRLTRHETPLRLARPSQATKISKPNPFAYPFRSRPRGVCGSPILNLRPNHTSSYRDTADLGVGVRPRARGSINQSWVMRVGRGWPRCVA